MKRMAALSVVYLLLATPASLLAKSPTFKIVIQGPDLETPIQISDAKVLTNFQVLSGKGTYANEPRLEEPSFIIDGPQGPTVEPPKALPGTRFCSILIGEMSAWFIRCRMRVMPSRAKGTCTCPARTTRTISKTLIRSFAA
jgi:hypothetical protein